MRPLTPYEYKLFFELLNKTISAEHVVMLLPNDLKEVARYLDNDEMPRNLSDVSLGHAIRLMVMGSPPNKTQQLWTSYRDIFPSGYIEPGYFDLVVRNLFEARRPNTILDIGGGVLGTEVLKQAQNAKVYLLDPNIDQVPEWMAGQVSWENFGKYDMLVLRGSINYLHYSELADLTNMLNSGGVLVANTFLRPPSNEWTERPYRTLSGAEGIERARLLSPGVVQHELQPNDGEKIVHHFNYFTKEAYEIYLPGVSIESYKENSAILTYLAP